MKGLSSVEVANYQKEYGYNEILQSDRFVPLKIFFAQFNNPLVFILIIVTTISFFLGEYIDTILLLVVVVFNAIFGFVQEFSAYNTIKELNKYIQPSILVFRDGIKQTIPVKEVVSGDTVFLHSGDTIPADGILVECFDLLVNEAIFTGEDRGVLKNIADQLKMGSNILNGYGVMEVTAIGKSTEFGNISSTLKTIQENETPLQKKLKSFSTIITLIVLITIFIIFMLGVIRKEPIVDFARMSIILAVAAIPEALAVTVTIILATGMRRIKEKGGLVRKLIGMETLGVTSVLCLDKTGTITKGEMTVLDYNFVDSDNAIRAITLNNFQQSSEEIALTRFVLEKFQNLSDWKEHIEISKIIPFTSENKYAYSEVIDNEKSYGFLTGAPDVIIDMCSTDIKEREQIEAKLLGFTNRGLKIIGTAFKEVTSASQLSNFKWTGIVGIEDPLRDDVKETTALALNSGIAVKIVTGDHLITATKVANAIGLSVSESEVITGTQLDKLSDEELKGKVNKLNVFARVTPIHKMRIIEAYQNNNEIVAMTGDGVNDILAIKKANIGIALSSATTVAKETAQLILIDNKFSTILDVCLEGRRTLSNIKKTIAFMMSDSFAESSLLLFALFSNLPTPLTIPQILWGHLICDGLPDIALCFEGSRRTLSDNNPKVLIRKPLMDTISISMIPILSVFIGLSSFIVYNYYLKSTGDITLSRTVTFITIALADILYIFAFRDLKRPIFTFNLFENKWVLSSFFYSLGLVLILLYIPQISNTIGVTPLTILNWIPVLAVAIGALVIVEISKMIRRKFTNTALA